jgi:hypothetical protein
MTPAPAPGTLGSKTIEITVSPKGEISIQTKGFAGASCRDASRFLEEALGARQGETLTAEFHQGLSTRLEQSQGT